MSRKVKESKRRKVEEFSFTIFYNLIEINVRRKVEESKRQRVKESKSDWVINR